MVMPQDDRMMRRKEFKAEDLLRYFPANTPTLVEQSKQSTSRVLSMLVTLQRQRIIKFQKGKWRVREAFRGLR